MLKEKEWTITIPNTVLGLRGKIDEYLRAERQYRDSLQWHLRCLEAAQACRWWNDPSVRHQSLTFSYGAAITYKELIELKQCPQKITKNISNTKTQARHLITMINGIPQEFIPDKSKSPEFMQGLHGLADIERDDIYWDNERRGDQSLRWFLRRFTGTLYMYFNASSFMEYPLIPVVSSIAQIGWPSVSFNTVKYTLDDKTLRKIHCDTELRRERDNRARTQVSRINNSLAANPATIKNQNNEEHGPTTLEQVKQVALRLSDEECRARLLSVIRFMENELSEQQEGEGDTED